MRTTSSAIYPLDFRHCCVYPDGFRASWPFTGNPALMRLLRRAEPPHQHLPGMYRLDAERCLRGHDLLQPHAWTGGLTTSRQPRRAY